MRILHLTLHKKWFDLIAAGIKKEEYREAKPYWTRRLFNKDGSIKEYDEIHARNGYGKDSPFIRIKYNRTLEYPLKFEGKYCYVIILGKVLETKNAKKQ